MYGIKILVRGRRACFSRPEFKVERITYEVPTASALSGLLKSVYWHPGIEWVIDRIHVLNPIRLATEMHNELEGQQRNTTSLCDVAYVVEAHFTTETEHPGKVLEIFNQRVRKGRHYRQPCLGLREYEADIELVDESDLPESFYHDTNRDFGWVLYAVDYERHEPPTYVHCKMVNGVVDLSAAVARGEVAR